MVYDRSVDNSYYPVTALQRYWLDNNIDSDYKLQNPGHGTDIQVFEVKGDFNVDVFKRAVLYMVQRHESLRSTFHELDGDFFMKIWDEHPEVFEFVNLSGTSVADNDTIDGFVNYEDHKFNLATAPAFFVRLVQIDRTNFRFSIKIHHVISDGWSEAILLSELHTAYQAFAQGEEPDHIPLELQYKDCLAFLNEMTRANAESDRAYWNSKHKSLPAELIIPGVNANKQKEGCSERAKFTFPEALTAKLASLAKTFSTSMFVILQATFKTYLFCRTRQKDILIGTAIFCRNWDHFENQIGCFARMGNIRTEFHEDISFNEAVKRVKKSTEDMHVHMAVSLENALGVYNERLYKITLQYVDDSFENLFESNSEGDEAPFTVRALESPPIHASIIAIDMQIEYSKSGNLLELEVIYDSSLYSAASITNLFERYLKYTDLVTSNPAESVGEFNEII
jgi:NRPS condensation-like uncharacterized protein